MKEKIALIAALRERYDRTGPGPGGSFMRSINVYIDYNDETGSFVYAVGLDSDYGYWLDTFETLTAAEDFCEYHNLTVTGRYNLENNGG